MKKNKKNHERLKEGFLKLEKKIDLSPIPSYCVLSERYNFQATWNKATTWIIKHCIIEI